jgi:CHAT domain-containing protein/Flp pilus assembly protein TadD
MVLRKQGGLAGAARLARCSICLLLALAVVATAGDDLAEARALVANGEHAAARARFEQVLKSADTPELQVELRRWIGSCLREEGDFKKARAVFEEAFGLWQKSRGKQDHAEVARVLNELAICWQHLGDIPRALAVSDAEIAMRERLFGREHAETAESLGNRATYLWLAGQREESVKARREALRIERNVLGPEHPQVAFTLEQLATMYRQMGLYREASARMNEAVEITRKLKDERALARVLATSAAFLESARQPGEGANRARQAIRIYERMEQPPVEELATAWQMLANNLLWLGELEEALRALDESARLVPGSSATYHSKAVILTRLKRLEEAIACYEQAIRLYRGQRSAAIPLTHALVNMSDALVALKRREEALRAIAEAVTISESLGHHPNLAGALHSRANLMGELGRSKQELADRRRAAEVLRAVYPEGDPAMVSVLRNLAQSLQAPGQLDEAVERAVEANALAGRVVPAGDLEAAKTRAMLGKTLLNAGRLVEAEPVLRQALAELGKHGERAWGWSQGCASWLAACLRKLGRPGEARPWFERALASAIRHEGEASENARVCRSGVAMSFQEAGEYSQALRRFEALLADAARRPEWLNRAAQCRLRLGQSQEALALTREALAAAATDEERATYLNNLAAALHIRGEHEEALAHAEQSMALRRRLGVFSANGWCWMALIYFDLGQPERTLPLLEEIMAEQEEKRFQARGLAGEDRGAYLEYVTPPAAMALLVHTLLALDRPADAVDWIERGRAREALDVLERSRLDPLSEAERRARLAGEDTTVEAIGKVRAELRHWASEAALVERSLATTRGFDNPDPARLASLEKTLAEAREGLRAARRERARLVRDTVPVARPATVAELRRRLGKRERLLYYSIDRRGGQLLVVRPRGQRIGAYALDAATERVKPAVERHLRSLGAGGKTRGVALPRDAERTTTGAELFKMLMPPAVWKELREKTDRVYLVPHGPLYRLPFESLETGDGAWLEKGPAIAYGPSGSVLLWMQRRRDEQRGAKRPLGAVAVGDPAFADGIEALPGTRREAEAIGKTVAEAKLLLGEDATERAVFELAPRSRLLHFATHQFTDETFGGSFSRLALAPGVGGPDDDGFLELHEVFGRWRDRLAGCELVVLSACQTRLGPTRRDEAPHAMPLGFLYAGAPAVIASLWPVDDASTAELFAEFYRRLEKTKGKGKLKAFTEARRALREKHPAPYHWAGFVYLGDPR